MNEETRLVIRQNWLFSLFEFAHREFQMRLWLRLDTSYPNSIGDYTEAICGYFDDLNLGKDYNDFIRNRIVTQKEYEIVKDFHNLLDDYTKNPDKQSLSDKQILMDIEWINLTILAKTIWEYLKEIIMNNEDLEFMNSLERKYLTMNTSGTNEHFH